MQNLHPECSRVVPGQNVLQEEEKCNENINEHGVIVKKIAPFFFFFIYGKLSLKEVLLKFIILKYLTEYMSELYFHSRKPFFQSCYLDPWV